jgi:hypothetical protein
MPRYHVRVKEVWEHVYAVEADSPKHALKIAAEEGDELEGEEYCYTIENDDLCMVEEVPLELDHRRKRY